MRTVSGLFPASLTWTSWHHHLSSAIIEYSSMPRVLLSFVSCAHGDLGLFGCLPVAVLSKAFNFVKGGGGVGDGCCFPGVTLSAPRFIVISRKWRPEVESPNTSEVTQLQYGVCDVCPPPPSPESLAVGLRCGVVLHRRSVAYNA